MVARMVVSCHEKTAAFVSFRRSERQPRRVPEVYGPWPMSNRHAGSQETASRMGAPVTTDIIPGPSPLSRAAYEAPPDMSPLIEQPTVQYPEETMKDQGQSSFAVGLIETQGFIAVFEAIDTALKTSAVEVLAREKLGGGYITVLIKGDVSAVQAAWMPARPKWKASAA